MPRSVRQAEVLLTSAPVLCRYNPARETRVETDAPDEVIADVLSQKLEDGRARRAFNALVDMKYSRAGWLVKMSKGSFLRRPSYSALHSAKALTTASISLS